jgi:hypothetical protein
VATKVVIENAILRSQQEVPQKVATVYLDGGDEYYVYAPSKATGDALEWLDHLSVRQLSSGNPSFGGEVLVRDLGRSTRVMQALTKELEQRKLDADIWRSGTNPDGRYVAAQICLRGHVLNVNGTDFERGEHCPQCGEACIDACKHCKVAIRGGGVYEPTSNYKLPYFCHKCGRPYPWMEDRLQTAKELLDHDDKLSLEDRKELWDLLQYVMSDPKSDLVPAKKKLIEISLGKAAAVTREIVLDLVAKVTAELLKP